MKWRVEQNLKSFADQDDMRRKVSPGYLAAPDHQAKGERELVPICTFSSAFQRSMSYRSRSWYERDVSSIIACLGAAVVKVRFRIGSSVCSTRTQQDTPHLPNALLSAEDADHAGR